MYVVGMTDGTVVPIGAEHLVGQMGGIWAHPLKVGQGVAVSIHGDDGTALPADHSALTESLSHLRWHSQYGGLSLRRCDVVAEEHAVFALLLSLCNTGSETKHGMLRVTAVLCFAGC